MPHTYSTAYRAGQDNLKKYGMDVHAPVFMFSSLLIIVFVLGSILMPQRARAFFDFTQAWSLKHFDWFFMSSANFFVIFCLLLAALPIGKVRLGGEQAKPDFSRPSWFAMLFAAGMGIGLMFWSVAEPVGYYTNWAGTPLGAEAHTPAAARLALGTTLFHWGLHPWSIYAVVALTLSFFTYNKGLPLTIRSSFFSFIGDNSWKIFGHVVDVLAVLATIFGLATSLGLGAKQAAGGLHYLFDIPNSLSTQILIIVGVTSVAIVSVVRGLEGGVKVLSNINIVLVFLLLAFVMISASSAAVFSGVFTSLMAYAQNIFSLSNPVGREDQKFIQDWTVFYWAWWISWSPFVGMFIARISRGRTVREFVAAVLIVPTLVTALWMGVFGGVAVDQVQNGVGDLAQGVTQVELTLFQMLQDFPFAGLASFLGITVVLLFFVTSSDSGSLVIDSITAGGKVDVPVPQRIFWATLEGLVAAALLFGGGSNALKALQAAAITVGLPFTLVLLLMCLSLYRGLRHELKFKS